MFYWIIGNSLRFKFLIVAFAVGLAAFGLDRFRDMPIDVFPEFAPPIVEIQTPSIGLATAEVEELVTVPIEQALHGIPNLDVMRSKSVENLSSVKLQFHRGTDLLEARRLVAERISIIAPQLPNWTTPPVMLQPLSATSRMMKIGLSSDTYSVMEMSMTAYWKIVARLLRVPGVAHVAIWGERLQMLQVQVDPEQMRAHDISLTQVIETTGSSIDVGLLTFHEGHVIGTGGFIDTPNQRMHVRHVMPVITPAELAAVPIEGAEHVRLGDVGNVLFDHQPMIGDGIVNDDIGLLFIVEKFPWANTLQVTRGVEEALDELRPSLQGIEIDHEIFRPATFIEMSIDHLTTALLFGALLVVVVLGAFLYEWRTALISTTAIPLSLIAAGVVLYLFGTTINVMILAGLVIALGAVVDDAIIDVENIVRRLRQARKHGTTKSDARIILEAAMEVRSAIVVATLIIIASVTPVFFLEGLSGAFFQPLILSYVLALAASLIVALTVTPALALILLPRSPLEKRESPIVRWLHRHYTTVITRIVKSPRPAYGILALVFALGIGIWPILGHELLPSFKERDFLMHWVAAPDTSHPEMNRITIQGSEELREVEGVRNFGAHIGQALLMDEVVGVHFGENWISLDPSVPYEETVAKIQEIVDGYPGLYRDVLTYLKERIREVLTGAGEALVIRIYGDDIYTLREVGARVRDRLAGIDGIVDLHLSIQQDIPQIQVRVDLERAQTYGLTPGDVRRAAAIMVSGIEAGDIHTHHGKTYDVQVWSLPEVRDSLTDIEDLLIDTPDGGRIRLAEVADINVGPVPNVIYREDMSRAINVEANVSGRDLQSVAEDVEDAIQGVAYPVGYNAQLLGEYAELEQARDRLLMASILAALVVFLLLQSAFGSWRLGTLAFLTLPSALVGGVLSAALGLGVISLGALVGFLTVFGIAARNSILLINHFQHLARHEGEVFGPELVIRGARERLAPILMTAITTGAALTPLVVAGEIPGHEIQFPLAVVVVGGLFTSTLLNLFVLPSLYLRFARPSGAAAPTTSGPLPVPGGG